jgi:hypothetical protein
MQDFQIIIVVFLMVVLAEAFVLIHPLQYFT